MTEPLNEDYPNESTTRPEPACGTSANCLIQYDSLPHPSSAKLQEKNKRQFGDKFFEERIQIASTQSTQMTDPPLAPHNQMQVQQHLQVAAPPHAPAQPTPRQLQVLVNPAVAKQEPLEEPWAREEQIFVVADHQRSVMSNLASLWKSEKLCDASIGNGLSAVLVHKVVLSAVCPKLLSAFSADMSSHKFMQVDFPGTVSKEALKAFAEYMYNGLLNLDCNILEQLKIIATRLDMREFEQLCDSHLSNHVHQPASATASFNKVPLIQMTVSVQSTLFTTLEVACPNIKTELVGPEDDKYVPRSGCKGNEAFNSTTSITAAATATTSSTEFAIPFTEATDVKSTKLKATHSSETPLVSDLSPVSGSVETVHSQSSSTNEDCSKTLSKLPVSTSSIDGSSKSTSNEEVHPVGLFTAGGDNLPLLAKQTVDNFCLACAKVLTMAKAKELSQEVRRVIIGHHNRGMGYRKISNELNIPISTIRAIIRKWMQHGLTTDLPRTGRPRKLSERAAKSICREVIRNPFTTRGELQKDLQAAGTEVSKDTISRALHRVGLHSRTPRKTPL